MNGSNWKLLSTQATGCSLAALEAQGLFGLRNSFSSVPYVAAYATI